MRNREDMKTHPAVVSTGGVPVRPHRKCDRRCWRMFCWALSKLSSTWNSSKTTLR